MIPSLAQGEGIGLRNAAKKYCDLAMSKARMQREFFEQMADPQAFRCIFEHLPEVYFFVKDRAGRMVAASPTILSRLGLQREEEFIGRTDHEMYPASLADAYTKDDAEVFRTGKPLVNRLETWFDESGHLDWGVTSKVPLRGRDGALIGLMGITRRDQGRAVLQPLTEAARAVEYLRRNANRSVSAVELAKHLGLSSRSLNRQINETFGVSPYELTLRVRVQKAAEALLLSGQDITSIALDHGFCDQSAFTGHFRKRMGITPKQLRLRHAVGGEAKGNVGKPLAL